MLHNNYQLDPPPRYDEEYFEAMEILDREMIYTKKDKGFPQYHSGEGVTSTPTLPERATLSSSFPCGCEACVILDKLSDCYHQYDNELSVLWDLAKRL